MRQNIVMYAFVLENTHVNGGCTSSLTGIILFYTFYPSIITVFQCEKCPGLEDKVCGQPFMVV